MSSRKELPPTDYLRQLLDYNPETGIFKRKTSKGGFDAGTIVGTKRSKSINIIIDYTSYKAHRIAWKIFYDQEPPFLIDHIDNNPYNNAILNLREANLNQNLYNSKKSIKNTTGYKGVSFHKLSQKFRATIRINNKAVHLGLYETAEDAYSEYCKAAKKHFGEYARFK